MKRSRLRALSVLLLLSFGAPALFGQTAPSAPAHLPPPPPPPPPPPSAAALAPHVVKSLSDTLTGAAKREYDAGKLLYGDGDYAGALVKFENAYDQATDPRLLWNMAACEKNLRHYARVLSLLQKYGQTGKGILTPQDRREADELAAVARAFVSNVSISVNEPGAIVAVDGAEVGRSPLDGPLLLDMGSRKISVRKTGFREWTQTQKVSGTAEIVIGAELVTDASEGRLSVATAGPHDLISIDGRAVGESKWDGRLTSGGHTLRVTAPGMRIYQQEVAIKDSEVRTLQVTLEVDPSRTGGPPWVLLAAGGALLAGAAVGSYFLFKPKDETSQNPVLGTIAPGYIQLSFGRTR